MGTRDPHRGAVPQQRRREFAGWVSLERAARTMRCSVRTMRRAVVRRELVTERIGGQWRIAVDQLGAPLPAEWLLSQPAPQPPAR